MTRFYGTQAWRRLRAECLRRFPVCVTPGCGERATVADHIVPRLQGGADTLENLVGRCKRCNDSRKGLAGPRLPGCSADGTPRDRAHWWHCGKNVSGLGPATDAGASEPVSSRLNYSGIMEDRSDG